MLLLEYKGKIYHCDQCGKNFTYRYTYIGHKRGCNFRKNNPWYLEWLEKEKARVKHRIGGRRFMKDGHAWNKGLTKETSESVRKFSNTLKEGYKNGRLKHGEIKNKDSWKKNVSKSMKELFASEKRHPWKDRAKGIPSYPEQFFMKLIESSIKDKDYQREFRVKRYYVDFMWVNKRKGIEIDGSQHEFTKEYDCNRDKIITSEGYQILRIKWKELKDNTNEVINTVNEFLCPRGVIG